MTLLGERKVVTEQRGAETPMVTKGAPLPLRLRFAHHNHNGKFFRYLEFEVLETRIPNSNLKATW